MKFKIDYRWENVGDHQDRYAHLDGKVIEVNSAKEADSIISDFVVLLIVYWQVRESYRQEPAAASLKEEKK